MTDMNEFTQDEVLYFAGCSLDSSPKSNWVENRGGLPEYICFAGETGVITQGGTKPIRELVGTQTVLTRESSGRGAARWVEAEVRSFGVQPLRRITLVRNRESKDVYATPEHRWFVQKGGGRNNRSISERTTDGLKSGDRLASGYLQSVINFELSPVGVLHGFAYGDGTVDGQQVRIDLFGAKDEALIPYVSSLQRSLVRPLPDSYSDQAVLSYYGFPKSWKRLPDLSEGAPYLRSWLAGYFAADGTVNSSGAAVLSSASRETLQFVRDVATLCGIATYGIKRVVRKGYGVVGSDLYSVTFAKQTLSEKFFIIPAHRDRFAANLPAKKSHPDPWVVVSVTDTDRVEEVFCAVVPGTETFVLEDNILTGNCRVARGIMRSGRSKQTAIQMAISRVKVWASGGGNVKADTRAKAAAAVAEWEKMKASRLGKLAQFEQTGDVLVLSATLPSFSLEGIRRAWDAQQDTSKEAGQVSEVWTDAVVVTNPDGSCDRVPFEMLDGAVSFGEAQRVVMMPVPVDLADDVLEAMADGEFEEEFEQDPEYQEDGQPGQEQDEPDEEMSLSVRRIRTPEGSKFYGAPIGSLIVKDKTGKLKAWDGSGWKSSSVGEDSWGAGQRKPLPKQSVPTPESSEKLQARVDYLNKGLAEGKWNPEGVKRATANRDRAQAELDRRGGVQRDFTDRFPEAKKVSLDDLEAVAGADMAAEERKLAKIVHPEKYKSQSRQLSDQDLAELRLLDEQYARQELRRGDEVGGKLLSKTAKNYRPVSDLQDELLSEKFSLADIHKAVTSVLGTQDFPDEEWMITPEQEKQIRKVAIAARGGRQYGEFLKAQKGDQQLQLTRRIRTPEGAKFYGAPIGTPIVRDRVTGKLKAATKSIGAPKLPTEGRAPKAEILPGVPEKATYKPTHKPTAPDVPFKSAGRKPKKKIQTPKQAQDDVQARADSYEGDGTPKNPKRVRGDVEAAALLLSQGKSIRMESPREVGTLVEKLAAIVEDAKKRGDKAPEYDLCKVSVPGTNIFCAQNKGIPRAEMPQFKGQTAEGETKDVEEGWRQMLKDKGIKVTRQTVPAAELKASQMQLDGPKVAGMSKAMEAGKIPDAPIFVTKDGYILDGHHRWAAKVAIDVKDGKMGDVKMPVDVIDIEIGEAIDLANAYTRSQGIVPKGLGANAEGVKPKKA